MPLKADWVAGNSFTHANQNDVAAAVNSSARTYATIAALKAATVADSYTWVAGYYSAGDGGGGLFRWDSSDTSSTDNGGTIITPTSGLSSSGRWKRVYDGAVNARWFGVNPSQSDNTAALQKAVNWVGLASADIGPDSSVDSGATVLIPAGDYPFTFDQGTSGLSTITVNYHGVHIRGEGKATRLYVNSHARPSQLAYFFTFDMGAANPGGEGGGVSDILFYGNSMLKWCIYLGTWHNALFERITAWNVHSGVLDAECNNTIGYWGEHIVVRDIDLARRDTSTVSQYGVRFRTGTNTSSMTWSDCYIEDCMFLACWDTGLVLDGCMRFRVRNIISSHNSSSTDSIDGGSKAGSLRAVRITNSIKKDATGGTGYHMVDGVYLESLQGSETAATNAAVWIDTPVAQADAGHTRYNVISNVSISQGSTCSLLRLLDDNNGGYTHHNVFNNNVVAATSEMVYVGSGVADTTLRLTPVTGTAWSTVVNNSGARTVLNGFNMTVPSTATSSGTAYSLATDGSYLYVCTAADTWRRVAIASW